MQYKDKRKAFLSPESLCPGCSMVWCMNRLWERGQSNWISISLPRVSQRVKATSFNPLLKTLYSFPASIKQRPILPPATPTRFHHAISFEPILTRGIGEKEHCLKNDLFKNYYTKKIKGNSVETCGVTDTCQGDDKWLHFLPVLPSATRGSGHLSSSPVSCGKRQWQCESANI